jgi:histidinol-phosphate aminotransferase
LKQQGLQHIPSYGNFVTFKVQGAAEVFQKLLRAGVIVRPVGNYGLPEWLRITVGLPSENETFLTALRSALGRA